MRVWGFVSLNIDEGRRKRKRLVYFCFFDGSEFELEDELLSCRVVIGSAV